MISNQKSPPMMLQKMEPLSPIGSNASYDIDEDWLTLNDQLTADHADNNIEISFLDLKDQQINRAQLAAKLLDEIEVFSEGWIKEEPFANWLEHEKTELFEELPISECVALNRGCVNTSNHTNILGYLKQEPVRAASSIHFQNFPIPAHPHQPQQPRDVRLPHHDQHVTQSLLQEFEHVLGDVEACHNNIVPVASTLTPPQTPPPSSKILVSLQPVHNHEQPDQQLPVYSFEHQQQQYVFPIQQEHQPASPSQWGAENLSLNPLVEAASPCSSDDLQQELAQVEAYVRSCAEDANPSSPSSFVGTSSSSEVDSSDDPDWSFDNASVSSYDNQPVKKSMTSAAKSRAGRRTRPYNRANPEDKRNRKKEQNKNAATRYRQKKKQEIKEIIGEEQELINRNEQLQGKVNDLEREIGYLKGLMRDLCKAKGLIK